MIVQRTAAWQTRDGAYLMAARPLMRTVVGVGLQSYDQTRCGVDMAARTSSRESWRVAQAATEDADLPVGQHPQCRTVGLLRFRRASQQRWEPGDGEIAANGRAQGNMSRRSRDKTFDADAEFPMPADVAIDKLTIHGCGCRPFRGVMMSVFAWLLNLGQLVIAFVVAARPDVLRTMAVVLISGATGVGGGWFLTARQWNVLGNWRSSFPLKLSMVVMGIGVAFLLSPVVLPASQSASRAAPSRTSSVPSPSPVTTPAAVTIRLPRPGSMVVKDLGEVWGIETNLGDRRLWIFVQTQGEVDLYPTPAAAEIQVDGAWVAKAVTIGDDNETNKRFDLIAVITTQRVAGDIAACLQSAERPGGSICRYAQLPEGTTEAYRITVIRS